MKNLSKILSSLVVLSALVATGCATNAEKNLLQENNITIEKVESASVHIGRINVTEVSDGIVIRGEVRRRPNGRGGIPGHMDIEILSEDGQSKLISTVKPHRRNHKSKVAKFKVKLDISLAKDDTIRITHFY